MKTTTCSGTVQRNNAGTHKTWPQPITGSQGVGCAIENASGLGARNAQPSRLRVKASPSDPQRRHGIQASTFGLPGYASRPGQAKAPARTPQNVAITPPAPLSLTLKITRKRMAVFATLATIEQRPVDEVIAECLADMAAHLTRTRPRLHLDEADRVSLERYLDSLERDEEERAARVGTTPAMRLAAYQSDMREAFPSFHDDEAAEFAHRCAGAGYVEITLAQD